MITPALLLSLREPYFSLVAKKIKTVEGRLYKESYKLLKVNDIIRFTNEESPKKHLDVKVVSVRKYPTFKEMLNSELEKCLSGVESVERGIEIFHSFPAYAENENTLGAIAIEIELQ